MNFYITINVLINNEESEEEINENIKILRQTEAGAQIFIIFKSFYYFKMFDATAPIVDIILLIFNDIKYFMIIFTFVTLSFSIAYYLLGKN